ncbi:cytochrome c3 family protein [Geothrix sp. SG200]|uniref:cytochrome c3 family protein n=1 Tax=Geothrix sp. SG200 TaxID=2922865 RepID=UPI001FADC8A7|nr:cytochrome c3 family protein [Geothrix sp. SG200]
MKSLLVVLLAAGSLSLSAGIKGTKHDLSASGAGAKYTTTQVCVFCHAPHNAATGTNVLANQPLWNRNAYTTTAPTFIPYTSATLVQVAGQPTGASLACFTCHDGTSSVGQLINMPTGGLGTLTGSTNVDATTGHLLNAPALGVDLSNDHPVTITYDTSAAMVPSKLNAVTGTGTTANVGGLPLFSGKVECASCHSVHDNTIAPFLRMTMTNSQLCTTCHVK